MHKLRIYVDPSVVGGCFDEEFEEDSRALMEMARSGKIRLLVSTLLASELDQAPENVQTVLSDLPRGALEAVTLSNEAAELRDAYLAAQVVGPTRRDDAYHVALATIARADMIVSWNFKHIVHFDKIRGFNAVNLREGYLPIEVRTPREVV
ncbi:MAG: PIN domain protein [Kiritimatiellae bacterium]|nr:PIN domain protein [Kiritimatiellia bacterium]